MSAIPSVIAGWPTEVRPHELGRVELALVCVRDLESRLDREALLRDDAIVPPYWALVWSGSQILARHVAENLPCAGLRVLDVGCGLGLVALAAAARGGRVTAIDREVAPITFLSHSATLNGLEVDGVVGDVLRVDLGQFDLILAAELLYERSDFDALAAALASALAPGGGLWLADARRVDTAPFFDALSRLGLVVREVCACDVREEGSLVRVKLVRLEREIRG